MEPDEPQDQAKIEIALATYNAEPWLDPFLESLMAQDFTNWRVLARDDGSTDDTPRRLADWKHRLGERLTMVAGPGPRKLGATGNFNAALEATATRWVMLADQDDVWLPRKISQTLDAMRQAESVFGVRTPLAI